MYHLRALSQLDQDSLRDLGPRVDTPLISCLYSDLPTVGISGQRRWKPLRAGHRWIEVVITEDPSDDVDTRGSWRHSVRACRDWHIVNETRLHSTVTVCA